MHVIIIILYTCNCIFSRPKKGHASFSKPHHYDVHDLPHGVQENRHIDSVSHGHMITTSRTWDGGLRAKGKTLLLRRKPGDKKPFKLQRERHACVG